MPGYPEIYGTRRNGVEYRFRDDGARQQVVELGEQLRSEHDNDMADLENEIESLTRENEALRAIAESAIVRAEKENDALVHYNYAGEMVGEPISGIGGGGDGGGGGDSSVYSTVTMTSETDWTTTTIRYGASCPITVSWSSILDNAPTGNGSLKVTVGTKTVLQRTVAQGRITVNVGTELKTGTNSIRVQITDVYGISKYRVFQVVCEEISISSSTDFATPKSSQFTVVVTPVGSMTKLIHFKLDGVELSTLETSVSNRPVSRAIPAQSHGAHSLEIWYTAELNGEQVESNRLYYEFVSFVDGNTTPIIVRLEALPVLRRQGVP